MLLLCFAGTGLLLVLLAMSDFLVLSTCGREVVGLSLYMTNVAIVFCRYWVAVGVTSHVRLSGVVHVRP